MPEQAGKLPVLYSFRRCPYAMRARLSLRASETRVAIREVVLRDKPAEMLAASPKGTVPVLVLPDTTVIEESLDIMLWALGHNDPHNLIPKAEDKRAPILALIAEADGDFKHHLDRYKYSNRYDNAVAEAHRTKGAAFLSQLNDLLFDQPFLAGHSQTIADLAIAPFVRQFANTDRTWFDAQDWSHLQKWLEAFLVSNQFAAIMHKYPQWHAGDDVTVF